MSTKQIKVNDFEKNINSYFNDIKKNKPLSKKEEHGLWNKYLETKDLKIRDKLVKSNLQFVPTIAKQYKGCGMPMADLISEGNIGLIKAIERFDSKKDTKIISYAVWWIKKCILEAIDKKSVLDTDNIDDFNKNEIETEENYKEQINNFIIPEVSSFENNKNVNNYNKYIIEELFDGLQEREKIIISDYYGLYGCTPKTLEEIGNDLKITKERVRQINEIALKKMRFNALNKNIKMYNNE